jgi:hypothetical protein
MSHFYDEERKRCRIYWVSCNAILELLGNWRHHDHVSLPVLKGLPDGYRVLFATHDFGRGAIGLMVHHPSFAVVPEGASTPCEDGLAELETVRVKAPGGRA